MTAILAKRSIRYRRMIDALMSRNKSEYADLVLQNGQLINVLTREIYQADVAIKDEYILLVGDCSALIGKRTRLVDVKGAFIAPGFIDSHMHFESSMLTVSEFSRLSLVSGTTTLVADPHEIANVAGIEGMRAMINEAAGLPNRVLFTIPCLTPDVPGLETAGFNIDSSNVDELLSHELVQGLGEMQGFSNVRPVYDNMPSIVDDLLTSVYLAEGRNKTVEGNAPDLFGAELAAHILVCGGNTSCHETTTKAECIEKLRNNVTVFMREGSTQKNMAECIKAVTEEGLDSRKMVLATDDMVAEDLLTQGHMNEIIRRTIACGVDPVEAIQMATINAAQHFGFKDIGSVAPGKLANLAIIDDLYQMTVNMVIVNGAVAAQEGRFLLEIPAYRYPEGIKRSIHRKPIKREELECRVEHSVAKINAVEVVPDQNLTQWFRGSLPVQDGVVMADTQQDVVHLFVVERHGKTGQIGKGFVKGMGIEQGAIAMSVAHDTHNIVACGVDLNDVCMAVNRVISMQGGIAMIKESKVVGDLALPVAGLITDEMSGREVGERIARLESLAEQELGCKLHAPFMHLSFLTLVTSPELKLTDKGLIDVRNHAVIGALQ